MKRRDFLRAAGLGSASVLASSRISTAGERAGKRRSRKPNIILIMADDCSARELGCYGHKAHKTPTLDRLAKTGVMFKTCWATPICSPSRAMIMTGRYGYRTGWFHNNLKPAPGEKGGNLADQNRIFAQLLKEAGYATAICGKWQLRGSMAEYGFDEHCMWQKYQGFDGPIESDELKGKRGALVGRAARYWHPAIVKNGKPVPTSDGDYGPDIFVDFILDVARRHKDRPFLAYYPMCLTHKSWDFEAHRSGYLPVPELDASGKKTGRKVPGSLASNVEYVDHLMARLLHGLDAPGLRDETIIMFTCDNGTSGYGKANVEQERGPRVPMIVNGPGRVKALGPVDALTDFSDVLPTLCDLAGAKLPSGYEIDGHSFAPILRGETDKTRDWIFSNYADKRMLRDERWLLDGKGRLYDCGRHRDERAYKDVTTSSDPADVAARKRFDRILERLPRPPDNLMKRWRNQGRKARKRKTSRRQRT